MLGVTLSGSGNLQIASDPLGRGGEGGVYAVISHSIPGLPSANDLVAKIYHEPEAEQRPAKLKAMIKAPVTDPAVAWPKAVVLDDQNNFLGYLMTKLDSKTNREWLYLANTKERNRTAPKFDVLYAFTAIRNLAAAILSVHSSGHCIGDINESNILVTASAGIGVVDSDSMQIRGVNGEFFRCTVGKPEYTAPELSYGSFRDTDRTPASDVFAFAVASFQLLTGGATPHQGVFDPNSPDDPLPTIDRIRYGVLPSLEPSGPAVSFGFTAKPGTPVTAFPQFLREHLIAFLSPDPATRETPSRNLQTLISQLDRYTATLQQCPREPLHKVEPGETCKWCAEASRTGVDPWSAGSSVTVPTQVGLPSIGFQNGSNVPTAPRRAAPQTPGLPTAATYAPRVAATPNTSSGYGSQQGPSNQQSGYQQAQASPTQNAPSRPKKIKGKVVVQYANGTWGQRPPLSSMLRQSPKMFLWAVKEETLPPLRFWWTKDRPLANPAALVAGLMVSLVFVYTNYLVAGSLIESYLPNLQQLPKIVIALIPAALSLTTTITLTASGFAERKRTGNPSNYRHENSAITVLRYIPPAIFYGVPATVIAVISGAFLLVRTVIRGER